MKVGANLFILLGSFVLGAGILYGLWGHELAGTFYLTVLGVAFMYLAHVLRHASFHDDVAAAELQLGEARGFQRRLNVHAVIHDVEDDLQDSVDDCWPTGAADREP